MARKNRTLLYVALGAAAWYFWQKKKGNNFFGQPVIAATPANPAALAAAQAAGIANPTAAQLATISQQIASS